MRITTWNHAGGSSANKLPKLLALGPSLIALQETPRLAPRTSVHGIWRGDNPNRGVALLARRDVSVRPAAAARTPARLFLPCHVDATRKFNVLVVWVKPWPTIRGYVTALLRGLAAYGPFIRTRPTIVLGDLNSNPYWGGAHFDVLKVMEELRLVSAYHVYNGETPGKETRGTYFDRTQAGRPYHLDYCFIPEIWVDRLVGVRLGRPGAWSRLSDHVPLTVELDLG